MTENAFWIARFPHGSLPADISVSIPLRNGRKRANGFMMPGGATVGPGVCQDLGDSVRLTAFQRYYFGTEARSSCHAMLLDETVRARF
jgi:hypothetical protein